MWKVVVFVEEIHAACNAFSEIYIYFIWKYDVLSKKNMLLDILSFMEWVYHIQFLRTDCVKRRKVLCSKGNFLDFHVVKLYALGCSVISHWIGSTVTSFCVKIVWKRWKISVLFKKFSWCECCKVICTRI
jgi:hypothetical protein